MSTQEDKKARLEVGSALEVQRSETLKLETNLKIETYLPLPVKSDYNRLKYNASLSD